MDKNKVYEIHAGRNPHSYVEACVSQGLPVEDEFLLERFEADRTLGNPRYVYAAGLVRLAGKRFPEGNMNADTVRRRLSALNKAAKNAPDPKSPGYEVRDPSRMKNDELFPYFRRTRAQIMGFGERVCPEIVSEVKSRKEDQAH